MQKILLIAVLSLFLSACVTNNSSKPSSNTAEPKVAYTGTGKLVIKPISFNKDAYIRDAVKKECNLDGKLTQFIEQNAANQYAEILSNSKKVPKNAQILSVEIEQVQGGGGGAWSGGKMVLINGKLTEKGKVIGSFKGRRYSGGGMFGAYKGTCAILGRCVKVLGKDIAEWLQSPSQNSALGDL